MPQSTVIMSVVFSYLSNFQ